MKPASLTRIAVFCGSSKGSKPEYCGEMDQLAKSLVNSGISLVYGGANIGMMGELADKMLHYNGEVIGVIPQSLVDREVAHEEITELHVVSSMHERKALMADLADGFILLPGGCGSLEEFFEVMTWAKLGFHEKPCGILNISGYYDRLLDLMGHIVEEGFMEDVYHNMLIVEQSPQIMIERFKKYKAPVARQCFALEESAIL